MDRGQDLRGIECKSGATIAPDAFKALSNLPEALGEAASGRGVLVYGGRDRQRRSNVDVVPWHAVSAVDWFG